MSCIFQACLFRQYTERPSDRYTHFHILNQPPVRAGANAVTELGYGQGLPVGLLLG